MSTLSLQNGTAYKDPCVAHGNETCLPYGADLTGIDPARIIPPFEGINHTGCDEDMILSDLDGNGKISRQEYATYVSRTAARRCIFWPELTLGQKGNFNSLACQCVSFQNPAGGENNKNDFSCCIGDNAHLSTAGAANPSSRTEPQAVFLENVCLITYGTLPGSNCSIKVLPIDPPPPVDVAGFNPRGGTTAAGTTWNLLMPIIASFLLLLLLCCCCCVLRRRRRKEFEEEEIIETEYPGKEEWLEQPLPEQSPGVALAVPAAVPLMAAREMEPDEDFDEENANRIGGFDDDEYSDDGGRRARGGNLAPEEEDDTKRRWPGGEYIPPEKEQEKIKLKPIPPKEKPPEPDWDEPQRDIEDVREKDDMSAQEFDPYVPDGGVFIPERPDKDPLDWNNSWQRGQKPEEDEDDRRKHRIQGGFGEGEIWDRLETDSASKSTANSAGGDVFDWVVRSAIQVMDTTDEQGHLEVDDESTVPSLPSLTEQQSEQQH